MSTILLFDSESADRLVIEGCLSEGDHRLIEAADEAEFFEFLIREQIDLAIVSLAAVSDSALHEYQRLLSATAETKVLALAPVQGGNSLTTLLRAESLRAHHLLAKPVDEGQLLAILHACTPLSSGQD